MYQNKIWLATGPLVLSGEKNISKPVPLTTALIGNGQYNFFALVKFFRVLLICILFQL